MSAHLVLDAAGTFVFLLLPLPLVITANAMVGKPWASHGTGILAGITSGLTFLFGALYLTGVLGPPATGSAATGIGIGFMVTAAAAAAVSSNWARVRLARILPVDPENPVHALALVLGVILFGTQIALQIFVDVLASDQAQPPLTIVDLGAQELPFLVIALAGVGLYIRRNAKEAVARMGLIVPLWWQITLAIAAAGVLFAFGQGMDVLSHQLTPSLAHRVDTTTQHVFGALNNPIGVAAIALLPAICEEILFRGALQPRLGLVVTAVLFTAIHTEYGLSFDTLAVFMIAIGLGVLRKYTNTTTTCVCHAVYNLVVSIGIGGDLTLIAIGAEVLVAAITAYGVWSQRHRQVVAAAPEPGRP